jgi:hypothetical protein
MHQPVELVLIPICIQKVPVLQSEDLSSALQRCRIATDAAAPEPAASGHLQTWSENPAMPQASTPVLDMAKRGASDASCDSTPPNLPSVPSSAAVAQPAAAQGSVQRPEERSASALEASASQPLPAGSTPTNEQPGAGAGRTHTYGGHELSDASARLLEKRGPPFAFHRQRRNLMDPDPKAPEVVMGLRQRGPDAEETPPWDFTTELPAAPKPPTLEEPPPRKPPVPRLAGPRREPPRCVTPTGPMPPAAAKQTPPAVGKPGRAPAQRPTQTPNAGRAMATKHTPGPDPSQSRSPLPHTGSKSPFANFPRQPEVHHRHARCVTPQHQCSPPPANAGRHMSRAPSYSTTPVDANDDTGASPLRMRCTCSFSQTICTPLFIQNSCGGQPNALSHQSPQNCTLI